MKAFTFLTLFILLASFSKEKDTVFTNTTVNEYKTILISPKSELEIVGNSNVTNFKCLFDIKNLDKPLRIAYEERNKSIRFHESTLVLENSFFDCGGRGINKDFHELLRTDIHPKILLTLKEIKTKSIAQNEVEALVQMQIAGVSRSYWVNVQVRQKDDLHIEGKLRLNITDFDLVAPKKMLGMIVVSEEIEIIFNLFLEEPKEGLGCD